MRGKILSVPLFKSPCSQVPGPFYSFPVIPVNDSHSVTNVYCLQLVILEDLWKLPLAFSLLAADPREAAWTPWTFALR